MSELAKEHKQCVHHWIIESPDGPTSKGRCRHCGIVAEFSNDLQVHLSNTESSATDDNNRKTEAGDTDDFILYI